MLALAMVMLAGCGSGDGAVDDAEIANRAAAISESANATVAAQISEIDQKAAEDATNQKAEAKGNPASAAEPAKQ